MSKDLNVALTLSVDKKEGESNLVAFNRAFDKAMKDIGKNAADIQGFRQLTKEIAEGKASVEQLDKETQDLYKTYKQGAEIAADRDILGIKQHAQIQKEIDETREAYQRLKASGQLTQKELAQAALKTEDRIRELKKSTNGWVESLESAKGSIAGLAGSAAGLGFIAGQAIEFESSMADVKKVVDGTDEQISSLTDRIKAMSAELPIGAEGLAQIAAAGGQLGVPLEKLDQFVELAAKMGVAFDLSVEDAGNAVAKLSNIFGIPIDNVEALGDAINTLGNTTAAREADILNVLTRVGGTAKQFKLSAEQTAALASTMIEMGAGAEVAGTGINALLTKLQTANVQGPEFKRALTGMGVSAKQLALDIQNNPQQALTTFLRTLAKLDDQSRAETLTKLFGQEYQDDIARLLNGLDKYERSLDRVTNAGNTAGAMQKEFAARMETTEAQIELMKNGLNSAAINLGSVFLPALRSLAVTVGDVSQGLASFIEANPAIAAITTSMVTAATAAGALRLAFLSLRVVGVKSFADINKEILLARGGVSGMTASVGKLGAAVRLVGGAFTAWQIGRDIGKYLSEEFEIVRLAGVRLAQAFTLVMETAGAAFKALSDPLNISDVWDEYTQNITRINTLYQQMYEEVDAGKDKIQENTKATDDMATSLEDAGNKGVNAAQKIRDEFAKVDLTNSTGVQAFIQQLEKAADNVGVLDEEFKKWLASASAVDLSAFGSAVASEFGNARISAEQFAQYNDAVLSASFKKLGADANAALIGRVSPAAKEAAANIDVIRTTLDAVGYAGEVRMRALEVALQNAVGKADTAFGVELIRQRVEELGSAGEISAEQLARITRALNKQRDSIEDITPGIQSMAEAHRRAGIAAKQADKDRIASLLQSYKYIKQNNGAVADQKAAFIAYAKAVIAANNGIISSELRKQAIMAGLLGEVENLGGELDKTGDKGEQTGDKTEKGAKKATEAVKQLGEQTQNVGKKIESTAAGLAAIFNATSNELEELSAKTANRFAQNLGIDTKPILDDIDTVKQAIESAADDLSDANSFVVAADGGFSRFFTNLNKAASSARLEFYRQKESMLELQTALVNGENLSESFLESSRRTADSLDLLGDEDLSTLRDALDSADSKLKSLQDSAENTLRGLQNELDRLQGKQDAIEQREYEKKKKQLQEQLDKASKTGDKKSTGDLNQALNVLERIRAEKAAKRQAAEQRKLDRQQQKQERQRQRPRPQSTENVKTVTVNINGSPVRVLAGDEDTLLDQLTEYGARTR